MLDIFGYLLWVIKMGDSKDYVSQEQYVKDMDEMQKTINLLMRRVGTVEKEITIMNTKLEKIREVVMRIIKELSSGSREYVDKGQQEAFNKRERTWFEMWGLLSDNDTFGD